MSVRSEKTETIKHILYFNCARLWLSLLEGNHFGKSKWECNQISVMLLHLYWSAFKISSSKSRFDMFLLSYQDWNVLCYTQVHKYHILLLNLPQNWHNFCSITVFNASEICFLSSVWNLCGMIYWFLRKYQ